MVAIVVMRGMTRRMLRISDQIWYGSEETRRSVSRLRAGTYEPVVSVRTKLVGVSPVWLRSQSMYAKSPLLSNKKRASSIEPH